MGVERNSSALMGGLDIKTSFLPLFSSQYSTFSRMFLNFPALFTAFSGGGKWSATHSAYSLLVRADWTALFWCPDSSWFPVSGWQTHSPVYQQ